MVSNRHFSISFFSNKALFVYISLLCAKPELIFLATVRTIAFDLVDPCDVSIFTLYENSVSYTKKKLI